MAETAEVKDGLLEAPQAGHALKSDEDSLDPPAPILTIDELLSVPVDTVSLEQISTCLDTHSHADVPELCMKLLERGIEDADKARGIIRIGISASQASWSLLQDKIGKDDAGHQTKEAIREVLESLTEDERQRIRTHASLKSMERKLAAWLAFAPSVTTTNDSATGMPSGTEAVQGLIEAQDTDVELDDPWETQDDNVEDIDDPWKDAGSDNSSEGKQAVPVAAIAAQIVKLQENHDEEPPLPLSIFLHQPMIQSALDFASTAYFPGLSVLRDRFPKVLFPVRTTLVEACPDWALPHDLASAGILPTLGDDGKEVDWAGQNSTEAFTWERLYALIESDSIPPITEITREPMTSSEIEEWYTSHILSLDQSGFIDVQLAWVQQAEATGISGLDELGEELSLLSELVYESNLSAESYEKWSLETWRTSSATDIISAYLSSSTPNTIVDDLKTRVLPYLYVLEARAERSGQPDTTLIERYLCETILSLPLNLSMPVFESSKATLPKSDRIIKDDLNVARLALACLYGSDLRDVWGLMSAIFECLPVWELSGRNPEDDAELTSTTLESIATFIRPSASQPHPPKAADLMMFFRPLPFASLSRALDILDVHLESGEILARWDVPVQLRFLLQSSRDGQEQVELAEKMVRRATASGVRAGLPGAEKTRLGGGGGEEGKWTRLWDDMLRLNGSGDQLLRGAFGMVDGEELMRVYLGGLLRSGKLDIARKNVRRLELEYKLGQDTLEAVVLATSRELYEGAETGNLNTGDMKIAYDCLSIAPSTPAISTERSFIEATSRLSTFALPSFSAHGGNLSPQEIRHTRNRLDLISSVLTHSSDAYRHESMILDLSSKLGLTTRIEKGRIWGMMARSAAAASDWETGDEYVCKASEVVKEFDKRDSSGRNRKKPSDPEAESSELKAVKEDCWRTGVIIGSAGDYSEIGRKMDLLGLGIELCPSGEVSGVLEKWRKVEEGRTKLDIAAKRRRVGGIKGEQRKGHSRGISTTSSSAWTSPKFDIDEIVSPTSSFTTAEERVLGSRTAARAAKMAFDITGRLGSHLPQLPRTASPSAPGFNGLSRTGTRSDSFSSNAGVRSGSVERDKRGSGEYTRALDGLLGDAEKDGGQPLGMEDVERVRRGARRALRQGVGWLLGAEEGEMG